MASVYFHAYHTIAVSFSEDVSPNKPLPTRPNSPPPSAPQERARDLRNPAPRAGHFDEPGIQPLAERGRALRESLLSSRTLSFCPTRMYWECLF